MDFNWARHRLAVKLLQQGVKLRTFPKEILEGSFKAAQQIFADESAKNPSFKKLYDSYTKYGKTQRAWFSVAEVPLDNFMQSHRGRENDAPRPPGRSRR